MPKQENIMGSENSQDWEVKKNEQGEEVFELKENIAKQQREEAADNEEEKPKKLEDLSEEDWEKIREAISKGRISESPDFLNSIDEVAVMIKEMGGLEKFKEARILDLGCGARQSKDQDTSAFSWWPHFSKLLFELGAHPVGIDISPSLSKESFEHFVLDLSKPKNLDFLEDDSFDFVHTSHFWDSPTFSESSGKEKNKIYEVVREQIRRVLKPGGIYFDNNVITFQKPKP